MITFQVQPEVYIVPLGTGNDLSRVLGLGEGYSGDVKVNDILAKMKRAKVTRLDRYIIFIFQKLILSALKVKKKRKYASESSIKYIKV